MAPQTVHIATLAASTVQTPRISKVITTVMRSRRKTEEAAEGLIKEERKVSL